MGFRPGDSTTKQLLYIVNEIHQAFRKCMSMTLCKMRFLKKQ